MNASSAFLNGASGRLASPRQLNMLNMFLAGSATPNPTQQRPAEREVQDETKKPDAFKNDPADPQNPNEARERHLNETNHR